MKSKNAWILLFVALVLVAGQSCRRTDTPPIVESRPAVESPSGDTMIVIPPGSPLLDQIVVETVRSANMSVNEVSAPGRIEFDVSRVGRIHIPVSGRVERVLVQLGDAVKAGQPVLTVDSPEAEEAVSAYRQAQAAVMQAQSTLARATADRDRTADLFEHKAAANKEVLAAENDLTLAKAAADQADAAREQSRRHLEILGLGRGDSGSQLSITTPLSGKVIELSITAGEYRNDTSAPVMTVADLSTVWVTSEIPETSIRLIEVGERLQIELVAYPDEVFEARVTRIADTLDPKTRTIQVRAELANPSGKLRPEMFGRIRHIHPATSVPVVPARAVFHRGPDTCLFIERSPGSFERIRVSLGTDVGGRIPVLAGIKAGDRIAVGGIMLLAGLEAH